MSFPYARLFDRVVPSIVREHAMPDFDEANSLDLALRRTEEFCADPDVSTLRRSTFRLALDDAVALYRADQAPGPDGTLRAFFAAVVELRLHPEMTSEQRRRLAELFVEAGRSFDAMRWPSYASRSFREAGDLYALLRLFGPADECRYQDERTRMRAAPLRARWRTLPLYWSAGFGYRPYRLLYVAGASVLLWALAYRGLDPAGRAVERPLVFSAMNYLAAVGYGDVRAASLNVQELVVAQGVFSLVLNSTLFALLVRRWFRT